MASWNIKIKRSKVTYKDLKNSYYILYKVYVNITYIILTIVYTERIEIMFRNVVNVKYFSQYVANC